MDLSFLGAEIENAISLLDKDKLYEIRIRKGFPVKIYYNGKFEYLNRINENGIKVKVIGTEDVINNVIFNLTEGSLYAFNDDIKEGYISKFGQRVGIAGEFVYMDGEIKTVKNIESLVIRTPHEVYGASNKFLGEIVDGREVRNTLIIAPKRMGKTTVLKDLARKLEKIGKNVLIIDERAEFADVKGENIDKYVKIKKTDAFIMALRTLSPDVIITDELSCTEDFSAVKDAVLSGVSVISSCHGNGISDLKGKSFFVNGIFDRYFELTSEGLPGVISAVYDKSFNLL